MDTNYFYKLLEGIYKDVFILIFFRRGVCFRTPDYVRHAELEPPVTMMLSHFSGGNPEYSFIICITLTLSVRGPSLYVNRADWTCLVPALKESKYL